MPHGFESRVTWGSRVRVLVLFSARRGPSLEKVNNLCWSFAKGSCRFGDAWGSVSDGVTAAGGLLSTAGGSDAFWSTAGVHLVPGPSPCTRTPLSSVTIMYCDNVSVVYLSSNPIQCQRTKHIEIEIHFVRDLVATGQVRALHVPSRF
uniref:NBS-containing resistance-like protein n=1 Tax=Tanacetum cinerariifolium TaxID=118510 RepID=A0A6L2J2C2_TANCI|nr:NBS-containing resistance-like protein [Tanacetum cinerariifolium]